MTTFLALFRAGHDTATIAKMTGCTEACVYNMMHREKLGEIDQRLVEKRKRAKTAASFKRYFERSNA